MTGNEVSRATSGKNDRAFNDERTVNSGLVVSAVSPSWFTLSEDVTVHSVETSLPAFPELPPALREFRNAAEFSGIRRLAKIQKKTWLDS
jgi:hypothetical protein